jgi:hypothetical protein
LKSGASKIITIRTIKGLMPGVYGDTLIITSNDGVSATLPITFTVTGSADMFNVSELDFGSKDVGYSAVTNSITFKNITAETITELTHTFAKGNFELALSLPTELKSGASKIITIRTIKGLMPGVYGDTLIITGSNGVPMKLPLKFEVTGSADMFNVSELDFGSKGIGYSAVTKSITFKNITAETIAGLTHAFTEGNFELALSLPTELKSGASKIITIRTVKGLPPGVYDDVLTITDNNRVSETLPLTFTVTGPAFAPVFAAHEGIIEFTEFAEPAISEVPEFAEFAEPVISEVPEFSPAPEFIADASNFTSIIVKEPRSFAEIPQNAGVMVYNTKGKLVAKNATQSLTLPPGIYIVKIGRAHV